MITISTTQHNKFKFEAAMARILNSHLFNTEITEGQFIYRFEFQGQRPIGRWVIQLHRPAVLDKGSNTPYYILQCERHKAFLDKSDVEDVNRLALKVKELMDKQTKNPF